MEGLNTWLSCVTVMFYCVFVTFPCGALGQVWYFIISISNLCLLTYFVWWNAINWYFNKKWRPRWNAAKCGISSSFILFVVIKTIFRDRTTTYLEISMSHPLKYIVYCIIILIACILKPTANRSPYLFTLVQKLKHRVYNIQVFLSEAILYWLAWYKKNKPKKFWFHRTRRFCYPTT